MPAETWKRTKAGGVLAEKADIEAFDFD